jgi:putative hydrolase
MKKAQFIEIDTHTHTVLSGHAFSTLWENIMAARKIGLKGLVIAEHGPAMPGGAPFNLAHSESHLPKMIEGVWVYSGAEANIIDLAGNLDIPEKFQQMLEFMIASLHIESFNPSSIEDNTQAMVNALKNVYVDVIGHPENPAYEIDSEELVAAAKRENKCLEMNSHSYRVRQKGIPVARKILELCKANNVRIAIGSDAHFSSMVASVQPVVEILKEVKFPNELIINKTRASFENYLEERRRRILLENIADTIQC